MHGLHHLPDPAMHPDFHERGHWLTDALAALDMVLVGIVMVAVIVGFWMALAMAIFSR